MDEKRFAVQLTDAQEVKIIEYDPQKDMFDIARDAIHCDWIELIEAEPLTRDGLLMMADEEGKLRNGTAFLNCIASYLYGAEQHGVPIVGHVVIVKEAQESLELLSAAEARQVAFSMEQIKDQAITKIAKAFGLHPAHKGETDLPKHTQRQPCRKNIPER